MPPWRDAPSIHTHAGRMRRAEVRRWVIDITRRRDARRRGAEGIQFGGSLLGEYRGNLIDAPLSLLPYFLPLTLRSSNIRVPAGSSIIPRMFLTYVEPVWVNEKVVEG